MICPKCSNTDGFAKFCPKCGTKMSPMPRCKCGEQIWPGEDYCSNCGLPRAEALALPRAEALAPQPPQPSLWQRIKLIFAS